MKKPILVIMAAGIGSRYGGPKQIDPVGKYSQLIIDYSIFDAKRAGFETVVFIISRAIESDFKEVIGNRMSHQMDVRYAYQDIEDLPSGFSLPSLRTKPWGTAQAIYAARDVIDAPFAVINADDFYGRSAFQQIYDYLVQTEDESEYVMVGYHLKNTVTEHGHVARGVCEVDDNGFLREIVERVHVEVIDGKIVYKSENGPVTLPPETVVSMNMWGFPATFLHEIEQQFPNFLQSLSDPTKEEFFLPSVVNQAKEKSGARIKVLQSIDRWYGVTYKEDKPMVVEAVESLTASGIYPEKLWA